MANYVGNADHLSMVDSHLYLTGKTSGRRFPPPGTPTGSISVLALTEHLLGASDYTYVDEGTSPAGTGDHAGSRQDMSAITGDFWFEAVHLLPRAGVDFGNIVTVVDGRFEIFNAHRYDDVTLLNIVNNALPGTELPDMPTPPAALGELSSFLDPLSTNLNPLKQIVRALADGLPNFDTTIDFQFGSGVGTLYLGVRGNRIALLTADFNGGLRETLQFKTDVLEHKDGSEQRISVRKQPRQVFRASLFLEGAQRQIVQALLFGWQGMTVALPVWPEQMKITAAITGGATDTAQVDSTDYVDLRVGGLAAVLKDDLTFDVLTVLSKTSTSVTFDQNIQNSYAAGDLVVPVRLTIVKSPATGVRRPVNVETIEAQFTVIENDEGAPTGDTSAFSSYNGKVLLDDFNFLSGTMSESFEQRVSITDNVTGLISQANMWGRHKRGHVKGFVVKERQDLWSVRRLLYALKGMQVSFYIPTFIEDLTVTQNLVGGTDTMDISWIGYDRFVDDQSPKNVFRITFTDDTSLVREVQSSSQLSGTEERLTLDATWPSSKSVSEIRRVEFYELVRFASDDLTIEHGNTVGDARLALPVKVVFD